MTRKPDRDFHHVDEVASTVYARSGIGARVGFGSRPALVVVDLQNGFTNPDSPAGSDLTETVGATQRLLRAARKRSLPIAFTAVGFDENRRDGTTWLRKMPGLASLIEGSHWCEIDSRVRPQQDEPVWVKRAASAFFGTPLVPFLVAENVDTLVVTGCVTSGCVRATVVDAVSWGYRTIVPLECVGDRSEGVHAAALFDIDAKYGDVEPMDHVIEQIESRAAVSSAASPGR